MTDYFAGLTDDFPTPPWATRALMAHPIMRGQNGCVMEPAAGRGYMARALGEYFDTVYTGDVKNYGYHLNFVGSYLKMPPYYNMDWIITNPPFKLAEQFIDKALREAGTGVAMLVRTSFLEGVGRYERLYSRCPPSAVLQFAERVPMVEGRYDPKASTATSYCWLVWRQRGWSGPSMDWIPPSRKMFEKPQDEC